MKCEKCGSSNVEIVENYIGFEVINNIKFDKSKPVYFCSNCHEPFQQKSLVGRNIQYASSVIIKTKISTETPENKIPFLAGRPKRDSIINEDDITNLKILLNSKIRFNEFVYKL